jgi:hypothetical protein
MTGDVQRTKVEAGTPVVLSLWREIELYLAFWAIARPPVPASSAEPARTR